MGYKREARVYKLNFEDPEFEGLVVRARSVPMGQFMRLVELSESNGRTEASDINNIGELFRGFAAALVDWNLEEDGPNGTYAVPATLEGLYSQDFGFVMGIILAWLQAIAGVASPLEGSSSSGETSLEASLPMETLSASPQSSTTQRPS